MIEHEKRSMLEERTPVESNVGGTLEERTTEEGMPKDECQRTERRRRVDDCTRKPRAKSMHE